MKNTFYAFLDVTVLTFTVIEFFSFLKQQRKIYKKKERKKI